MSGGAGGHLLDLVEFDSRVGLDVQALEVLEGDLLARVVRCALVARSVFVTAYVRMVVRSASERVVQERFSEGDVAIVSGCEEAKASQRLRSRPRPGTEESL